MQLEEVDPVFFDRTYYLAPADAEAQRRPYVLLLRAMEEHRDGRDRQVRPLGEGEPLPDPPRRATASPLETLFFAEDVRAKRRHRGGRRRDARCKDAELELAEQVIASLVGRVDAGGLRATSTATTSAQMLEAKLAGQEIVAPEPAAEAPVIDLMEALRQSVADAQSRRSTEGSKDGKAASRRPKAGTSSPAAAGSAGGGSSDQGGSRSRRKAPAKKSA